MRTLERWRVWRAMRRHSELSPSCAEGSRVRASGVVHALDETVIAPLSGRRCVLSRSRIRSFGVVTVAIPPVMVQTRPFIVETAAVGDVVVDGAAAVFGVDAVKLGDDDNERTTAFALRFAISATARVSFEEIVIAAGDRITV